MWNRQSWLSSRYPAASLSPSSRWWGGIRRLSRCMSMCPAGRQCLKGEQPPTGLLLSRHESRLLTTLPCQSCSSDESRIGADHFGYVRVRLVIVISYIVLTKTEVALELELPWFTRECGNTHGSPVSRKYPGPVLISPEDWIRKPLL